MLIQIETDNARPGPRLPDWLRRPAGHPAAEHELKSLLRSRGLHTVCEEARCPNRNECFSRGSATFMILGDTCSRSCGFCAVKTGAGVSLESLASEPESVALAAREMRLKHVVITSVDRDELPEGGASHFARTILAVRRALSNARIEVLTPDFKGQTAALDAILNVRPDVFNHNIETVPRLYRRVRPQARYSWSLDVLSFARAHRSRPLVKSGLMVGLGEYPDEVRKVLADLMEHGVQVVTIGQYLQPTLKHLPVAEYIDPGLFEEYRRYGAELGFKAVFAGPFVRSSYMAEMVHHGLESA